MHTKILIASLLIVSTLAGTAQALPGEGNATVTLVVDASNYPVEALQEVKTCTVKVSEGATVSTVLDQATFDLCIAGWTWIIFPTFLEGGRFVTGIDGRQADCTVFLVLCTFWLYDVNGTPAQVGVDFQTVSDGDVVAFTFNGSLPV